MMNLDFKMSILDRICGWSCISRECKVALIQLVYAIVQLISLCCISSIVVTCLAAYFVSDFDMCLKTKIC